MIKGELRKDVVHPKHETGLELDAWKGDGNKKHNTFKKKLIERLKCP